MNPLEQPSEDALVKEGGLLPPPLPQALLPPVPSVPTFAPVALAERYSSLDVIRGAALFGVLLVNLVMAFRVCIYEYFFVFHTHSGTANHVADYLREIFLSGKALTLFTLLFGVGLAMQYDRARASGRRPVGFLLRRLFVLFCFGVFHFLFLWDGDVLILYSMCGCVLLLFVKASPRVLVGTGLLLLFVNPALFAAITDDSIDMEAWREPLKNFSDWYAHGNYWGLVGMRWDMMSHFVMMELLTHFLATAGLMLLGMAVWRSGIVQHPENHSRLLWTILWGGGLLGFGVTFVEVFARASRLEPDRTAWLRMVLAHVPLALAYGSAMFLYLDRRSGGKWKWRSYFAATGRMALTNYLMQSLIFSFIFYGYGLGLFGKVSTFTATLLGILVYLWQLRFSRFWLKRYQFGPVEWLWRWLTYGRRGVA